jgi:hypothetical protein
MAAHSVDPPSNAAFLGIRSYQFDMKLGGENRYAIGRMAFDVRIALVITRSIVAPTLPHLRGVVRQRFRSVAIEGELRQGGFQIFNDLRSPK